MKIFFSLIKSFINDFRARKGGYIFISDILIKINSLILSFLIVRIISSEEYGNISYARAVIFPLTAFIGLGANHALLRFGPIQKSKITKWNIFRYSEKKGFIASLLLVLIVIISSSTLTKNLPGSKLFLIVLSFQLLFNHLNLTLKNLMRILKFNKLYGFSGISQSIILLILSIGLAIFFKGNGYVVAISLTPLVTYLLYRRFFKNFPKSIIKINY